MKDPCIQGGDCKKQARALYENALKYGMGYEVRTHYRYARKRGDCPCWAMWAACYEWDI